MLGFRVESFEGLRFRALCEAFSCGLKVAVGVVWVAVKELN